MRSELSWARWGRWRRSRPFWGGLVSLAGGLTILLLPANYFTVLALPGVAGLAGFLLGGLIAAMGPLSWFLPEQRVVLGIAIVLLALASFVYSNLGGFLIGMLLSIIGGSLAFAWKPSTQGSTPPHSQPSPTPGTYP
ncbi:DUF6114 domain-containing protein [Saccharopolyspora sp. NPDC049426]|uniref:DUF6114 domain-containing protein n=1 Tax=Saccharopolyspora sp. NPDC049426 TaxID=3155652 RepID=UPI003448E50C